MTIDHKAPKGLQTAVEAVERLRSALRPFAALRLSTEGEISDCLYRTPADEMRLRAEAIERRDAEILEARAALKQDTPNAR